MLGFTLVSNENNWKDKAFVSAIPLIFRNVTVCEHTQYQLCKITRYPCMCIISRVVCVGVCVCVCVCVCDGCVCAHARVCMYVCELTSSADILGDVKSTHIVLFTVK